MSDYEKTQARRNIIVGIFVIFALAALVWLVYRFGELPTKVSEYKSYQLYVQFPNVVGIQKGTPVRFRGYQIGRVTQVKPPEIREDLDTGREYHQSLAVLSIDKEFSTIPSTARINVMTRGLGSSYVEIVTDPNTHLKPKDPNRPETRYLTDEMFVQGSMGSSNEFFPKETKDKVNKLLTDLTKLVNNTNEIVGDKENQQNLKKTLQNLTIATNQAKTAIQQFNDFSAAGKDVLKTTDKRIKQLFPVVLSTTEQLDSLVGQLNQIVNKINKGQGSIGKLVNNGKLYENLIENTEQLELLLKELKAFTVKASEEGLPLKLK